MKITKTKKEQAKNLPQIKILSVKEVDQVELKMDVPDSVLDELVEYGKKIATKEDYFRIAFHRALVDGLKEFEEEHKKKGKKK